MLEAVLLLGGSHTVPPGEIVVTTPGTYSVLLPPGVETVSIVGVGAGADGTSSHGGGGGALVYANNVDVSDLDMLTVTVGENGTASIVQGMLTAEGGRAPSGGVGSDGSGNGGRGGVYAPGDSTQAGGGGGAAGRYTMSGGNGAVGSNRQEISGYSYRWEVVRRVTMSTTPGYLGYPHDYVHSGTFSNLPDIESSVSPSNYPNGSVVVIRTPTYAYFMQAIHLPRYRLVAYVSVSPTGTIGMGRGGDSLTDGEGVDLFGSNNTPSNNGYGYGGGRNRPGGLGAVRIIWGKDRSFPSNANRLDSETVEEY